MKIHTSVAAKTCEQFKGPLDFMKTFYSIWGYISFSHYV